MGGEGTREYVDTIIFTGKKGDEQFEIKVDAQGYPSIFYKDQEIHDVSHLATSSINGVFTIHFRHRYDAENAGGIESKSISFGVQNETFITTNIIKRNNKLFYISDSQSLNELPIAEFKGTDVISCIPGHIYLFAIQIRLELFVTQTEI